jgi:integrase
MANGVRNGARYRAQGKTRSASWLNFSILCAPDGALWRPETFTGLYFKFMRRIGVNLRFHDLRHTHASQLLKAAISAKVVSERLGHRTAGITLDV